MTTQTDITSHSPATDGLTIRPLGTADAAAVATLAERDTTEAPGGQLMGAELGGRLIAAMPLHGDGRGAIADPFSPTADAVAMLEARVQQLRGGSRRKGLRLGGIRLLRGAPS